MRKRKNKFWKWILFVLIFIQAVYIVFFVFDKYLIQPKFECDDCNVVIIVFDALRKDHLGVYGYKRNTSPNIDKFAEKAYVFNNAYSQYSSTKGSIGSLFTSLYPDVHYAVRIGPEEIGLDYLDNSVITISEILKSNGLKTLGVSGNPHIRRSLNFHKGFDVFISKYWKEVCNDLACFTTIINELLFNQSQENFFLYVHYLPPHAPYDPPHPYNTLFTNPNYLGNINFSIMQQDIFGEDLEQAIDLYDGNIRFADNLVEQVFYQMKEMNVYDNSLIIITADHGEAFRDNSNQVGHGMLVYENLINVPLIVKFPNQKKKTFIDSPVELIDIFPTITDFLRIKISHKIQGESFISVIKGENMNKDVFSSSYLYDTIISNDFKLIVHKNNSVNYSEKELYHLKNDSLERKNLIDFYPEVTSNLEIKLLNWKEENKNLREKYFIS